VGGADTPATYRPATCLAKKTFTRYN
jgi:hypothetical protein